MTSLTEALVRAYPGFGEPGAHDDGVLQCHEMVGLAAGLPEARGHRAVTFDEAAWGRVSEALREGRGLWPRFRSSPPREVLVDMADGSMLGHSFLVGPRGRVVDPYLELRGAPDADVQALGRYLLGVYGRCRAARTVQCTTK